MKIKKIQIVPYQEIERESFKVAKALDQGRLYKSKYRGTFVESLDILRSIFTDQRLALWRLIRDHKPESISELAKLAKRSFRSVHRDLKYLEAYGLISMKKSKGKRGDRQVPTSLADQLVVAVA